MIMIPSFPSFARYIVILASFIRRINTSLSDTFTLN